MQAAASRYAKHKVLRTVNVAVDIRAVDEWKWWAAAVEVEPGEFEEREFADTCRIFVHFLEIG